MYKLIISEPWDFGTINGVGSFTVDIQYGSNNNLLVIFQVDVRYNKIRTRYLLGRLSEKYKTIDLRKEKFEKVILELAFVSNLNEQNFKEFDFEIQRGNFLMGELTD